VETILELIAIQRRHLARFFAITGGKR